MKRSVELIGISLRGTMDAGYIKVGGSFYTAGLSIAADEGALKLDDANIGGSLVLSGMACVGIVRMSSVKVAGFLYLLDASILAGSQSRSDIVNCSRLQIGGGVWLDRTRFQGSVALMRGDIGESLRCFGIMIEGPSARLLLDGTRVESAVHLERAKVEGPISMTRTRIDANLRCESMLAGALFADGLQLKGALHWLDIKNPEAVELALDRAVVGELLDSRESWPAKGKLSITAASFERLTLVDEEQLALSGNYDPAKAIVAFNPSDRVAWLGRQSDINVHEPKQWVQLAKLFKNEGNNAAGRWVLFCYRTQEAARVKKGPRRYLLFGFAWLERDPLLVAVPILSLVLLGGMVFGTFRSRFAPTSGDAYKAAYTSHKGPDLAPAYPRFSPMLYSIENTLPGIRLGQDDKWAPDARLGAGWSAGLIYWSLVAVRVLLITSGWALGVALVAAISARFQR